MAVWVMVMRANTNQTKRAQYIAEATHNLQDVISSLQRAQDMDEGKAQARSTDDALAKAFTALSLLSVASEVPANRK